MKIFVTGGTGFVGSHFIQQALAQGHSVTALKRKAGTRISIPIEPAWISSEMDELSVDELKGHDVLVHLAAHSANVPYDSLSNCLHWNVTVPIKMAEKAIDAGINSYVVAGSCFEYGVEADKYDFIPTNAQLRPAQSYPISKAAASIAWEGLSRERAVNVSIARIFQVYGEGEAENRLYPSLVKAARSGADFKLSSGTQIRDFINVKDVATRILEITTSLDVGFSVKHIGTGIGTTVADFVRSVWMKEKATGELQFGSLEQRKVGFSRLVAGEINL